MLVISALEIKKLTQQISGIAPEKSIQEFLAKDREEKYQLSRDRVSNWDNTILGQRRKKLEARNERKALEEAERADLDRIYALEEVQERSKLIERARKMQYYNHDSVKSFHSKVLLYHTLKERDLQIQAKKLTQRDRRATNRRESEALAAKISESLKSDALRDATAHVRRLALARSQMLQMREKLDAEQNERNVLMREQMEYVRKDEEHRVEEAEKERQKKLHGIALRQALETQTQEKLARAEESLRITEAQKQRNEAWTSRKCKQVELKKEIEKRWFDEASARREQIGDAQIKISMDADLKIEERVAKAIIEKEEKAKQEEASKIKKKLQRKEDLKYSHQEFMRRAEEEQNRMKKEEADLLRHYKQEKEEADRLMEEKKATSLK
ncbi:hypothetical protein HK100_011895, partial [Physocladia obscura]